MISITEKTLKDLEFHTILQTISDRCNTEIGMEKALQIQPFKSKEILFAELAYTNEYVASFSNNNALPNHGFETVTSDLKLLAIEDSFLELVAIKKILDLSKSTNEYLKFLKKFSDYYPELYKKSTQIEFTPYISKSIEEIVNKFGEIKDDASPDLVNIRRSINVVRGKINQSFGMALSHFNSLGYLDDIKETVVDNRRVLAVQAMYRKK